MSNGVMAERPETIPCYTYRVETPDGTMFIAIGEIDGVPREVHIQIGKAGTPIRAWCSALESLLTLALAQGIPLLPIITEVSGHTSAKFRSHMKDRVIRSGPEGVAYALMKYIQDKKLERNENEPESPMEYGDLSTS